MQPTMTQVRHDKVLTQLTQAFRNPVYIWEQFFKTFPTGGKESGQYFVYDQGPWFRPEARIIAPGDVAPVSGFTLSKESFKCEEYGLSAPLPVRIEDNSDPALSLRASLALFTADNTHLKVETDLASRVFVRGVWRTDYRMPTMSGIGRVQWNNPIAPFLEDISGAKEAIRRISALEPNTLVLGASVWARLRFHPDIIDKKKYTKGGAATIQELGEYLELTTILVGKAVQNTAPEGVTPVYADIWGPHAWLGYVTPTVGPMQASAGYTMVARDMRTRTWFDEARESNMIKSSVIADPVVTARSLGVFFENAIAIGGGS
ncbi:MAG: hypothetical protein DDT40_01086 [candidate division WS2 bacterium]|nr:hypothetical protein [Candidatus Psychracetigena formicireducens]